MEKKISSKNVLVRDDAEVVFLIDDDRTRAEAIDKANFKNENGAISGMNDDIDFVASAVCSPRGQGSPGGASVFCVRSWLSRMPP